MEPHQLMQLASRLTAVKFAVLDSLRGLLVPAPARNRKTHAVVKVHALIIAARCC